MANVKDEWNEIFLTATDGDIKLESADGILDIYENENNCTFESEGEHEELDQMSKDPLDFGEHLMSNEQVPESYAECETVLHEECEQENAEISTDLQYYKIICGKPPYKCNKCFFQFSDYILFRDHQKETHRVDPLVFCDVCHMPCGSKEIFLIHRLTHAKPVKSIQERSKRLLKLTKKMNKLEPKKKKKKNFSVKCKICDKTLKNQRLFDYHMLTEHPEELEKEQSAKYENDPTNSHPYKCEICVLYYTSECGLRGHQVKRHGLKKPPKKLIYCDICQHPFTTNSAKKTHKKKYHRQLLLQEKSKRLSTTGNAEDSNQTTENNITFKQRTKQRNMRVKKMNPFKCTAPNCKNRYGTEYELDGHQAKCVYNIGPNKDSQCEFCGMIFKYGLRAQLNDHQCMDN